jgi:methylmalonyl-CoA mutase
LIFRKKICYNFFHNTQEVAKNLIKIEDIFSLQMPNELSIKSLLSNFPTAKKSDWLKEADTENNRINNRLSQANTTEVSFQPYYDREDHKRLQIKNNFELNASNENIFRGTRSWINLPPLSVNDVRTGNRKALNLLQQGADGILYDCPGAPDFKVLFNNIQLDYCSTFILPSLASTVAGFIQYCDDQGHTKEKIHGGIIWKKIPEDIRSIFTNSGRLKNFSSLGLFIQYNSNPILEINEALRFGVDVLDKLMEEGAHYNDIISNIFFSLESGNDFFFTIAKLKALRILWYQVIKAYKGDLNYDDIYLHVRCEHLLKDSYAPGGNMLKSPLAALSAVSGGCQALSVYSEDSSDIVMERIALNVSHILREESHVNIVADPLAGSYFIDSLVEEFARNAWELFQNSLVKS